MISFIKISCKSRFFVFNEYDFKGELLISVTSDALEHFSTSKGFKVYNPLEDTPELFTELAKLDITDPKGLVKFASNYGLPYSNSVEDNLLQDSNNVAIHTLDIKKFSSELKDYKRIFKLWKAIKYKDLVVLNEAKNDFQKSAKEFKMESDERQLETFAHQKALKNHSITVHNDTFYRYKEAVKDFAEDLNIGMIEHSVWELWEKNKQKSLIEICELYLTILLNDRQYGKPTFDYFKGHITPAITFSNPLEAAYYQLSKTIVNNIELRECGSCGQLFEVTHEGRRFCPPLPGRKRSTCENTYNQRIKRQRQKERKGQ